MMSNETTVKRVAVVLFTAAASLAAGCGGSNPPAQPDAAPAAPDATSSVEIGNGATVCHGQGMGTTSGADVGPDLPDEIGDPAVARITPPSYPFTVTAVSYRLTGMQATCGTNIAHAVTVYAAPGGAMPPATPADAQHIAVAAGATDEATAVVTEQLPTPITLTQGQDLFVAVEMDANAAQTVAVCLDGCLIGADDNRNWWSEQKAAPFTWSSLYSFGIEVDYAVWAEGKPQ